ncbi:MAG: LysR family transcriptional regulator [Crocinitomicaceae bacterium]|nr:LysR family transcriptional regulator [Flavobacteriales bacterium]NQZ37480.1 LysR family transcriptional regulator [Crocinitomicaceae bacterium]
MISIQQMQYILVLSEEQQFQRASEKCFVTQPTLSMQLKKAENTLGSAIFDRSTSPLELTPFGELLLPIVRDILSEYGRISELTEKQKGVYRERVRIGIIPTVADYMVPDLFNKWKSVLTDVQLSIEEMKTEDVLIALDQKKIDIGILAGPVNDPRLRTSVLFQEEILAFVPESKSKEVTTEDLGNHHPWLLTSGNCLRTQMIHFCSLNTERDDWNYEGGNLELLKQMVVMNGGYTLIPERSISKKTNDYKRIRSSIGEIPARQIIALSPNRSTKWGSIEKIVRSVQLNYGDKKNGEELKLLSWE